MHSLSRRLLSTAAAPLCALAVLALVIGWTDAPLRPTPPAEHTPLPHGGHVLGLVEVTMSGIGSADVRASARSVAPSPQHGATLGTAAGGVHLALHPLLNTGNGSIQLEPITTGSFTNGVRGSGGERYFYATFKVRNAQEDGGPYGEARTNLTFVAVSTSGGINTIDGTAIAAVDRFDSSAADPALVTQILPTGHVVRNAEGQVEARGADVLQVLTESEAATLLTDLQNAGITSVTSVLPYSFVTHNPSTPGSRTLAANPAPDQFDGVVTFAFKVPLQATPADDPFTISAMFLAVDDDQTRVTQSLEEESPVATAAVEARARALSASTITLLPGGTAFLGDESESVICSVRTAGTASSPTATLDLPAGDEPWLVPSPWGEEAQRVPYTVRLAALRCPGIPATADSSAFVIHGFQHGLVTGTYAGAGTTFFSAPAPAGVAYFPGEEVEATLTTALGGTKPVVARYRVAARGGSGIFEDLDTTVTGFTPQSVVIGDWNHDDHLDLATADAGPNNVAIAMNDGSGHFTTKGSALVTSNEPVAILAADVDADGDLDFITADKASNDVSLFVNDGLSNFTRDNSVGVGTQPDALAAADLDGDGDIDLAVANSGSDNVSILTNDGSGTFTVVGTPSAGDLPAAIAAADFDGDGDIDLAAADQNAATVTLLQNDGTGTFTNSGTAAIGSHATSMAAADLDGDGDVDLAVINANDFSLSALRNDGTGRFTGQTTDLGNAGPIAVTALDADADGDMDLALLLTPADAVSILRNDGAGHFTFTEPVYFSDDPTAVAAGDLDNDGKIDLAVTLSASHTVSLLRNR